jgi:ribosomal protein L18E
LSITESQISDLQSYITGNQTITLSGDVSGSGTTSISVTIAALDGGNAAS